jgi:8-oxo-dGDP phosphatase
MADLTDEAASWPVLQSSVLAEGRIVTLRKDAVQLPDGQTVQREVVEHPGAVAIVALDSRNRILLIRQYRHPAGAMLWELPAGLRDVAGEPLLATAQRELLEEAGYRAKEWHVLSDYLSSPGISTERLRVYLARDLTMVPAGQHEYVRHDEEAYLTVAWVPLADAVQQVLSGDLHNGVAIVGILSAYVAQRENFRAVRPAADPESL